MSGLPWVERPAAGDAAGLLVLHHGRGGDEHDLLGLADALDPGRRLHVVAPGGPLRLPNLSGRHWYVVPRVGYPDPETFRAARAALADFHDALWARTGLGPRETVLGGFSMGAVMSHALGLDPRRPAPAGILTLAGFVPTVEGWAPDLLGRAGATRVLIAHGRRDPVIDVDFAHRAAADLRAGGLAVDLRLSDAAHHVDPAQVAGLAEWIEATLSPDAAGE